MRHAGPFVILVFSFALLGCPEETQTSCEQVPYAPYPYVGSSGQSRTPVFAWKVSGDVEGVTFEITVLNPTGETVWNQEDIAAPFQVECPATLDEDTDYVWWVTPYVTDGPNRLRCGPGETWGFRTGTGFNNPPMRPVEHHPTYEDGLQPFDAVLTWDCHDPDGDPLTFDVHFGAGPDMPLVSPAQPDRSYDPGLLEPDTDYSWRIRADDGRGGVSWSGEPEGFRTRSLSPPDAPFAPSPADGADGVPVEVNLSWSATDPDGEPLVFDVLMGPGGGPLSEITSGFAGLQLKVTGLAHETVYEWQVVAEDAHGLRTPGAVWRFTTEADPGHQGVYAELVVHRSQSFSGTELTRLDHISARFDGTYAPGGPVSPLRPAGVTYDTGGPVPQPLAWDEDFQRYYVDNPYAGNFLAPGATYHLDVSEGGGVPALAASIYYPECRPYLTSPSPYSFVVLEGLELVWANHDAYPDCARPVTIRILDLNADWTPVAVVTENDGSYTLTSADLAGIDPAAYQLMIVLVVDNRERLVAAGYDSRSWIEARTWATQIVYRSP